MKKAVRSVISTALSFILVLALSLACPSYSFASGSWLTFDSDGYNIYQYVQLGQTLKTDVYFEGNLNIEPHCSLQVVLDFSYPMTVTSHNDDYCNFHLSLSNPVFNFNNELYYPVVYPSSSNGSIYYFYILNDENAAYHLKFSLRAEMDVTCLSISPSLADNDYYLQTPKLCEAPVTVSCSLIENAYPWSTPKSTILTSLLSIDSRMGQISDTLSNFSTAELKIHTDILNKQLMESQKQTGVMDSQLVESKIQTGVLNSQLDESKKQTQALTKFENSGKIESDSASLGSALDEYNNLENSLFETANSNIVNFDLSLGFNFGPAMTSSIAFVSTVMMSIITAMSDFSMIYTAGMCLVFVGIIFGLWKFVSGSGGDKGS